MTDLYNNIADRSGVTRRRNPYNAKVVRSFIERGKHAMFVLEEGRSIKCSHHINKILIQFDIEQLYQLLKRNSGSIVHRGKTFFLFPSVEIISGAYQTPYSMTIWGLPHEVKR